METATLRRTDEVSALKKIPPISRMGVNEFHDLAMRFSSDGWKELLIHLWQQQARCLTEVEIKIRELGGQVEPGIIADIGDTPDPEDDPGDPLSLDKMLLLRCVNRLTHILHIYSEIRRMSLTFDVRMILQRHHLQCREMLERLSALYLAYPPRSVGQTPTKL